MRHHHNYRRDIHDVRRLRHEQRLLNRESGGYYGSRSFNPMGCGFCSIVLAIILFSVGVAETVAFGVIVLIIGIGLIALKIWSSNRVEDQQSQDQMQDQKQNQQVIVNVNVPNTAIPVASASPNPIVQNSEEKIFCAQCGNQMTGSAVFCQRCGSKMKNS